MCNGTIGGKSVRKIYIYNTIAKSNNEIIKIISYTENTIVVCDDFVKSEMVESASKSNKIILLSPEELQKHKIHIDERGKYILCLGDEI